MDITPRVAMAALALFASTPVQQAPVKLAYVDVDALMAQVPGRPAAESTFQKQSAALNLKFSKLTDSAKVLEDKYAADEPKLLAADKTKRQKEIGDFEAKVQTTHDEYQGQLEKMKEDLMLPLQGTVKEVLDDIRTTDGYTIIFDNSPSGGTPIATADKNLDITEKALLKLKTKPNGTVKRPGGGGRPDSTESPLEVPPFR